MLFNTFKLRFTPFLQRALFDSSAKIKSIPTFFFEKKFQCKSKVCFKQRNHPLNILFSRSAGEAAVGGLGGGGGWWVAVILLKIKGGRGDFGYISKKHRGFGGFYLVIDKKHV